MMKNPYQPTRVSVPDIAHELRRDQSRRTKMQGVAGDPIGGLSMHWNPTSTSSDDGNAYRWLAR